MSYLQKIFLFLIINISCLAKYDLTLIGRMKQADGMIRISIGVIDFLKKDLSINFIPSGLVDFTEVSDEIKKIVTNPDKSGGNVAFLLDHLWRAEAGKVAALVPKNCKIKIAYSMHETNKLPPYWVDILNKEFDALAVPDEFLVDLYSGSGVKIPIFVLPIGLYLEDFLSQPVKPKFENNRPFIFGMSGSFWHRKNYEMIIDAFAQEFGNNPNVQLHLHGRFGLGPVENMIESKLKNLKLKNIFFTKAILSNQDYLKFLSNLDCYVLLSKGEGYSVGPREAMALGIPCILTNNSAQMTLCKSGLVRVVNSDIFEPAKDYKAFFLDQCGFVKNCTLADARTALREVYTNYNDYLLNAHKSREWVKQYTYTNINKKIKSLIKPSKVILGDENKLEDALLITNSKNLYNKYLSIIS